MEALDKLFIDFIKPFLQIEYLDEISVAFPQQSLCWLRRDVHSVTNNLCYRSSHTPAVLKRKEKKNNIGSHHRQAPVLNQGQGLWIWSRVTEIWCCAEPNPKQEPQQSSPLIPQEDWMFQFSPGTPRTRRVGHTSVPYGHQPWASSRLRDFFWICFFTFCSMTNPSKHILTDCFYYSQIPQHWVCFPL